MALAPLMFTVPAARYTRVFGRASLAASLRIGRHSMARDMTQWRNALIKAELPANTRRALEAFDRWAELPAHGKAKMNLDTAMVEMSGLKLTDMLAGLYDAFKRKWIGVRVYTYGVAPDTAYSYFRLDKPPKVQKPRAVRPKAATMALLAWELSKGDRLRVSMMIGWIQQKGFCSVLVGELIEEFRTEMVSKGLLYADFRATFQTYLNKGYLSKKPEQVLLVNSPHAKDVGGKGKEAKFGVSL